MHLRRYTKHNTKKNIKCAIETASTHDGYNTTNTNQSHSLFFNRSCGDHFKASSIYLIVQVIMLAL